MVSHTGGAPAAGAGGPFGNLQVPFMGSTRLQSASAAWGMSAPLAPVNTSPINGLLSLRGKVGGSASAPEVGSDYSLFLTHLGSGSLLI